MKTRVVWRAWFLAVAIAAGVATAGAQEPPRQDEWAHPDDLRPILRSSREHLITIWFAPGAMIPQDDFGDVVENGFTYSFGGLYRYTPYFMPTFSFDHAFLSSDENTTGRDADIDYYRISLGARVYPSPRDHRARLWLGLDGGWGHYATDVRVGLEPVFETRRNDRDDFVLGISGGVEVRLVKNIAIGAQVRENLSFTVNGGEGEDTLKSLSALGMLILHY